MGMGAGQLMAQGLTLPVAGLMTDPGPFTAAPEGGLVEAQNVVILRPGVVEPRTGQILIKDSTLKSNADDAYACYGDPTSNIFVWAASPWIIRQNGTTTITGPDTFLSGRIRTCPTGGRGLFTSENGVCTLPSQQASPANGSATIAYRAGMPQPHAPAFATATVPTGYPAGAAWLPNGESVAYRVTLRRRLEDGTLVESAPSCRCVVTNSAGAARGVSMDGSLATGIYRAWTPGVVGGEGFNELIVGDELCIYRSARIAGTPSDEMRLRAVLQYNTAFDGFTSVVDGAATPWFDGLDDAAWAGPTLYTSNTQEGAALANYRPEYARDIALYNGMTFYGGARTPMRLDATLKKMGTTATVNDPDNAMCSFAFTGDTTAGVPTITNVTNVRYFSIGQVITTAAQAPGNASATFPANTVVQSINVATNTIGLSANAGVTAVGVASIGWDWIESTDSGSRIYCNSGVGTLPTRYFSLSAESLDNRWNGDNTTQIQLRCSGVTQTEQILCSWFQPDCTDATFSIRSTKPLAWDVYIDRTTGAAAQQLGSIAELQWTKVNEPEHCPIPYRTTVGDAAYAIRRIEVARNSLLIFKDDGLYQCFGSTPDSLSFELLDRTIIIPAAKDQTAGDEPAKWVGRFDDRVFAMTTRGPMQIGDAGAIPVGAPILESLRQRFIYAFGAFDESLRALMIDTQSRRVGFFYDETGSDTFSVGYVLDVERMTWTYWKFSRPVADFTTYHALQASMFAGSYFYGYLLDNRTSLDDGSITVSTMPTTYESWPSETCTINTVAGTGPYTITIAAGSEWTPVVGDILIRSGTAHEVTSVTSSTVFESDTQPTTGSATWRESFESRVVWLARAEGNVTLEKHWMDAVLPFESSTLLSRATDSAAAAGPGAGRMKSYFKGYRNLAAADESFVDTSQTIGVSPWPIAPAYKKVRVPPAFARDWALRVGFSIRQAGVWFSTAGISLTFATTQAPNRAQR
jgi:hypothetical protein